MPVQRMGHGLDWEDLSNVIKMAQLYPSGYILFDQVGGGSTIEESRTEGCDSVHQGADYS